VSTKAPKRPTKDFPKVKTRTFPVPEKCIVACLRPRGLTEDDWTAFIQQAAHQIHARLNVNTIVVGLEHWKDLRVLDEAELERIGFIHRDRIFMLKEEVDLSQYSKEDIEQLMHDYVVEPLHGTEEE
jgi:hypothetical protein